MKERPQQPKDREGRELPGGGNAIFRNDERGRIAEDGPMTAQTVATMAMGDSAAAEISATCHRIHLLQARHSQEAIFSRGFLIPPWTGTVQPSAG